MEKFTLLVMIQGNNGGLPFIPCWHVLNEAQNSDDAKQEAAKILQRYQGSDMVAHLFRGWQLVDSGESVEVCLTEVGHRGQDDVRVRLQAAAMC